MLEKKEGKHYGKKKRIFLLLPEISKETSKEISIPTTKDCYNENANVMMLNVYEHYRTFYSRRKATCLALQLIEGFDEIWYYAGYGITDPIKCCLKKGEELNIPIRAVKGVDFKKSFSCVYLFLNEFHPSQEQSEEYWKKVVHDLGVNSSRNPLIGHLLVSIMSYLEAVYRGELPPVEADNKFNKELRSALNFAIWADKNGYVFDENGVNPKKLSTEPTPLLEALLDGYYKYHLEKQKILSENKIEKEQE